MSTADSAAPGPGATVPAARYTSAEFMRREQERMWPRVWLMAAHASQLRSGGSFVRFDLGVESLLIVRQADGQLRAFHNVCLHRGTPLCLEAAGTARSFTCPYHGWRWGQDGQLQSAPDAWNFAPDPEASGLRLAEVRCEAAAGFVWVTLGPDAPALSEYLGELGGQLEAYDLGSWQLTQNITVELAANWKSSLDAHNETYHVHRLHPQALALLDDTATVTELHGRHSSIRVPFGRPSARSAASGPNDTLRGWARQFDVDADAFDGDFAGLRRALQAAARRRLGARGVDASALDDDALIDTLQLFFFPNLQLNQRADELLLFRHRPHPSDPGRMLFDQQHFQRPAAGAGQGPASHQQVGVDSDKLGAVTGADVRMVLHQQRGLASSGLRELRLGGQERCIAHMHHVLTQYTDGDGP